LLDYLAAGDNIDGFVDDFPSVTLEEVVELVELARELTPASTQEP
jgi:uncharacterized protein (DUF433 family)